MPCYRVTNLLPVGSQLAGYTFTAAGNAVCVRQTVLPIPVSREPEGCQVVGWCRALQQEPDGTVTALVDVPPLRPDERLGLTGELGALSADWAGPDGHAWQAGARVITGLVALWLTTTPDPCGDVETITPLPCPPA